MKDDLSEILPIVDVDGVVVGCATRGECHGAMRPLHPVVHLHVFNSGGELYLQKRPQWKDIQPDKWDTAVGGHVAYGESVADALCREVYEELGISDFVPEHLMTYLFSSDRENELVYVYSTVYDGNITPSDELEGGRFWHLDKIRESIGNGVFTPNFEGEISEVIGILSMRNRL